MTLRRKFIAALVGMVIFMALIFAVISLFSIQSLLGHTVNYIEQSYTQQWNRILTYYYQEHGSWAGIEDYLKNILGDPHQKYSLFSRDSGPLLVFDNKDQVVAASRPNDIGKTLAQFTGQDNVPAQWHEIEVNGTTVGHFWLDRKLVTRESKLARNIAQSIIVSLLIGLVLTSLLALLLGVLLTRHFTVPLRSLTKGVQGVAKGDLSARLPVKGTDEIAVLSRSFNTMSEQLAHNEEVRRNMVADIAHELRTPLSVILGKLESIQEGVLPAAPPTLLPIQDETIRLIRLVRDLQQLSLAEAGKLPMNVQQIDLRTLLEKIFANFTIEFEERGIKPAIDGTVPVIQGDPDRLTQVMVNLIGNALLHTPPGGAIRVDMENYDVSESMSKPVAANDWVRVSVEDNGEGIPPEELMHIFDRFYRVNKARERETGSTGLGLAIAKEFVQAHGGTIEVESTVGAGSRFIVSLPVNFLTKS